MKRILLVLALLIPGALFGQASIGGSSVSSAQVTAGVVSGPSKLGLLGTSFTNLRSGTTTALTAGALTVSDPGATASTRYFFTTRTLGTITLPGSYRTSAVSAGVSFTIQALSITDTSTVDWLAIEP